MALDADFFFIHSLIRSPLEFYRRLKQWPVLSVCQRQGTGELRRAGVAWLFVATQPFSSFQWLWASLALANAFRAGPSATPPAKALNMKCCCWLVPARKTSDTVAQAFSSRPAELQSMREDLNGFGLSNLGTRIQGGNKKFARDIV
jgi:hypothetical protein